MRAKLRRLVALSGFRGHLALIAVAGLVIRVTYVLVVVPHVELGPDAVWYAFQAGTIADGRGYIDPARYFFGEYVATASFPPLWPSALAAVHKVGGDTTRAYQLTGAVLGTGTVILVGLLGRRVATPSTGLVAAALVAASPFLVSADGSLMADTPFVLLITTAVLLAYASLNNPLPLHWLGLGALVGLAALARSDGLVLGPLLIAVVTWHVSAVPQVRRIAFVLVAFGAMVIVLAPWTIRNITAFGDVIVLSNNSGGVIEGANCAATYGGKELGRWDDGCLRFYGQRDLSETTAA